MIDYKKHKEFVEKKLAECAAMPYSKENYETMRGYWKDLYHINSLCEETPAAESIMSTESMSMPDTSGGKSEFEKTVWGIIKSRPGKDTIANLIKEIDKFVEMQRLLHPGRYSEFISKLKEMK